MENKSENKDIIEMLYFLGAINKEAQDRFFKIKDIFSIKFSLPEIDFIREEIGKCFVLGADHGCILLTNMLLERYCKQILIYKKSGFTSIQDLTNIEKAFAPAIKKYKNFSLEETLKECKDLKIFDESALNLFLEYKHRFRDGFFHSDSSKVLKGQTGNFVQGNFNTSEISAPQKLVLQNVPPFSSLGVKVFAQANSYGYFVSVENLIRTTIRHYINEKFEIDLQVVKPQ